MEKYYLIMDIGMTKTTCALFSEDGTPKDDYFLVVPSKTKEGAEAVYANTCGALHSVMDHFNVDREQILGIGVGAPGPLDVERGVIIDSPMMGVHEFPLADRLKKDFGMPVRMDNDGNLGAMAEQRLGEGKSLPNVLYMTVSTGCGGGAVLNGRVFRGSHDSAAEFGHISIDPEGDRCPCGNRGCLELLASGTGMRTLMRRDIAAGKKSKAFEAIGYDPEKVEGKYLTEAAAEGDEYALDFYRREGRFLGRALATFFNCFDPDVFVLGGGVTKAKAYFHDEMMRELSERAIRKVDPEQVKYSVMNDRVVAYGAYLLIKEYLEQG